MQKKISKTSSSNCLLILHWPFDQRDKIWDNFNEYSLYISRTKKLLKNICSIKIIKKVNYRVSHNHENIDNLVYFKKLSKKINIDFSKTHSINTECLFNFVDNYGLDNGEPMTLKEIGQRIKLSRERVRQIENDALARLQELVAEGLIEKPEIYDEQYLGKLEETVN